MLKKVIEWLFCKQDNKDNTLYSSMIQNLNRQELFELGRKAPYYRFYNFQVEVTTDDILSLSYRLLYL